MDKINSRLSCIFHSMFGIIFGIIIIVVFGVYVSRYPLCIPAALIMSAAFLFVLSKFLKKKEVSEKKLEILIALLFLCMTGLQLYLGYLLRITPSNDRNVIYQQAKQIADSGIWKTSQEWNYYFLRYPNNRILLLVEAAYFSIANFIGISDYLIANIVLNIAMINLSIIFMLRLARKIWNRKVEFILMFLCFFFVPFYLYGPFVYTDSLTLPIVAGVAYLYYRLVYKCNAEDTTGKKFKKLINLACLGTLIWFGYSLKATIAILLVAIIIHLICIKKSKGIWMSLILLSTFLILQVGSNLIINHAKVFNETNYDTENFPYTHWIMMGLKGVGNYELTEREYTSSFPTKAEKEEANIQVIRKRLTVYGTKGLLIHQLSKGGYTWSNGMYDMEFYLANQPIEKNVLQKIVFRKGSLLPLLKIYTEGYHLAMLGFMLVSILVGIKKKQMDLIAVLKLAVFGLLLFLMIWETRPRYLMHFVPLFFLISIDGQLFALKIIQSLKLKKCIK